MSTPTPLQDALQTRYAGTALLLRGESLLARYNAWIVDLFMRQLPAPGVDPAWRVLDFGAGIGTLSQIFRARTGLRPEGVELDPAQRRLLAERGFVTHASLTDAGEGYDLIFTSNVLEHIEDDVGALAQLQQRLRPGGLLLVYVPAFRSIWTTLDDRVGHYRRYTRGELEHKLAEASLQVTRSRYCDSVGFGLAWAFRFIGSESGEPSDRALRFFDRWLLPLSRALDTVAARHFGKNVLAVAVKPAQAT